MPMKIKTLHLVFPQENQVKNNQQLQKCISWNDWMHLLIKGEYRVLTLWKERNDLRRPLLPNGPIRLELEQSESIEFMNTNGTDRKKNEKQWLHYFLARNLIFKRLIRSLTGLTNLGFRTSPAENKTLLMDGFIHLQDFTEKPCSNLLSAPTLFNRE